MEWNGIVMSTAHSVQVAVSGAWSLSAKWAILRSTSPNSWQRDSGPCKDAQGHLNELELLVAFRENAPSSAAAVGAAVKAVEIADCDVATAGGQADSAMNARLPKPCIQTRSPVCSGLRSINSGPCKDAQGHLNDLASE